MPPSPAFRSFWLAGYDGADHHDRGGRPLSVADITQHVRMAGSDYAQLRDFGIHTVRESVGWRVVDRGNGRYDFGSIDSRIASARKQGLQIAWTLCHYGWPDGLDPLSNEFVDRFARYARAVALYLGDHDAIAPVYTPIEEISYLAWAAANGHLRDYPTLKGRGAQFKRQLVRAAIAACDAMRAIDPRARFLHTDPLMHVVAPADRPDLAQAASEFCEAQYEAWDLIGGRKQPELGGQQRHLDLIGVSYYLGSQWEMGTGRPLGWRIDDPRRKPFSELLGDVHRRYGRPLVIAETGHTGVERGAWVREIAFEVQEARTSGIPVEGICVFPIIDRPDLQNPAIWHSSGLWELEPSSNGTLQRRLNAPYARAIQDAQLITRASEAARSPGRRPEIA